MNPLGSIVDPTQRGLLVAHLFEVLSTINCVQLGTIQSYAADPRTATVSINAKRVVYNNPLPDDKGIQTEPRLVAYPLLSDVPVYFPSGGGAYLTFPVKKGDPCILLFNDRDIDVWLATGTVGAPNSSRMHHLSDAIALVGIANLAQPTPDVSADNTELRFGGGKVVITPDGAISVSANGAQKIKIENAGGSLKSALDSLMSALTSWVDTHGDSPNPATVLLLNAAKTAIDDLLS